MTENDQKSTRRGAFSRVIRALMWLFISIAALQQYLYYDFKYRQLASQWHVITPKVIDRRCKASIAGCPGYGTWRQLFDF